MRNVALFIAMSLDGYIAKKDGSVAVSYTHLDVYKRQLHAGKSGRSRAASCSSWSCDTVCPCAAGGSGRSCCTISTSYTASTGRSGYSICSSYTGWTDWPCCSLYTVSASISCCPRRSGIPITAGSAGRCV